MKICTTQKMKLPLRIFLVKVTKSNGNCGSGYIYEKKKYLANGKLHFLFSVGSFARKQITR